MPSPLPSTDAGAASPDGPDPIELRPLEAGDIGDDYVAWFRDEAVTRFLEARDITRQDAIDHLEAGQRSGSYRLYGIWHRRDGLHLGNIKIGPIDHKHRIAECSAFIGRPAYWGRGLATVALEQAIAIAFGEMDLRKLCAGIIDGNAGSVRAFTKAGFVVEARLKGQYLLNGEAVDKIELGCFNPTYFGAT